MNRTTWVLPALILCLGTLGTPGRAGAAEVSANIDRTQVRVGDQIRLVITARGSARSVPEVNQESLLQDFEVYNAGQSQSVSMVNGKVSVESSRTIVLVPKREGTFTVGPLEVRVGGDVLTTDAITITVSAAPPPPSPPPGEEGEAGSTKGTEDLFVRASVDKAKVYAYEQVTLRVRLYTRVDLLDNPGYSPPSVEGFWKEDLPPPDPSLETVNGRRYRVLEVRMALFPTRPGKLNIGEAVLECSVVDPNRPRDPWSLLGRSLRDGKRVVLRTDPVVITVRELPEGAPPGFDGAVGEYRLSVDADRRELDQADPLTLTVRLEGEGPLRTVGEIELPASPSFRSYPSTASQEQNAVDGRIRGTLTQQFVLVPLRAGELEVPRVRFTYFSPGQGTYRTLESEPLTVRATAGASAGAASGRGAIELVGRDIRFIETEVPRFTRRTGAWDEARPWLASLVIPFVAYLGVWGWVTRERRRGADRAGRRRALAGRRARARLRDARRAEIEAQAAAAGAAIRGYVADRFDLPEAGMTPEGLERALASAGRDPTPTLAFLERTDAARYAPASAGGDGWLEEAEQLLDNLERA